MNFLNLVADRMFLGGKVTPDNPRNVQIYMKIILEEVRVTENQSKDTYRLRMQGHIELKNHINLFGDLDK